MIGGVSSPLIPVISSNQRENRSNPSTKDLNLGYEEFPLLRSSSSPSGIVGRAGKEDVNPNNNNNNRWTSCFKSSDVPILPSSTKLKYQDPKNFDGEKRAFFSAGEIQSSISCCESLVVGYFVGKKLGFSYVKDCLNAQWKTIGEFSMTIHGEQVFLFKFSQEEDRIRVLELGSVYIGSQLFLIRPWSPFIEQQISSISSVPIWLILKDVPIHLWNEMGFSKIASLVGKPIMTDTPTAMKTRMAYARVCVEVDANCTYPATLPFQIEDKKYEVRAEYPWKPKACSYCKSFGHNSENCRSNPAPKAIKKWVPKTKSTSTAGELKPTENSKGMGNQISIGASIVNDDLHDIDDDNRRELITKENAQGFVQSVKETISAGIERNDCEILENETRPIEEEWVAYSSKKKNARRTEDVAAVESIGHSNPFSILDTSATAGNESLEERAKNIEEDPTEDHIPIVKNSDFLDDMDLVHLFEPGDVQEDDDGKVSNASRDLNAQRVEKISALLNDPNRKQPNRNIIDELNEKFQKSRKERELVKLGWKEEPINDKLGRGHRKVTRKKMI